MTGLVRKATLLVVLGLLATAAVAAAGIPDPVQSDWPAYIDLVTCSTGGVAYPAGHFSVYVADAAGNPVSGCEVTITFNSDVKIYDTQAQTVACPSVTATSGTDGYAWFTITGAGKNSGTTLYQGANAATISACLVTLGTANVCTFDENGAIGTQGLEVLDLSGWGADYLVRATDYRERSDFNHNGALDVLDLSAWGAAYTSVYKYDCGNLCP